MEDSAALEIAESYIIEEDRATDKQMGHFMSGYTALKRLSSLDILIERRFSKNKLIPDCVAAETPNDRL